MGIITTSNKKQTDDYLLAADAIKYLAYIDDSTDYSAIAKFLIRNRFDESTAEITYGKRLDETFYCVDNQYDEFGNWISPASIDEEGNFYSADTRNFIRHVAICNSLDNEDMLSGYRQPFNLYWKKEFFKKWVEEIFKLESANQNTDLINLPDIDGVLSKIKKEEMDLSIIKSKYRNDSTKENNKKAIRELRTILKSKDEIEELKEENQNLKLEIEKYRKPTEVLKIELEKKVQESENSINPEFEIIRRHRQYAPEFAALIQTLLHHSNEYKYKTGEQPLKKNVALTFKEKANLSNSSRRPDEVARILGLPEDKT